LVARLLFLLSVVIAGAAVEASCTDAGPTVDLGIGDGGPPDPTVDTDAGDAAPGRLLATVRFAHLAAGVGAIDFCYQGTRSGASIGPVWKPAAGDGGDAGNGDAGRREIAFGEASRYFTLEAAGPLSIAVVLAGASSCANPIAVAEVTLDPGKRSTVVLFGRSADGGPPPLAAFVDDPNTSGSKARVRVIHGAPGVGAFAARVATSATILLAERVEPRRASSPSAVVPVDSLGYATIEPVVAPASIAVDFLDAATAPWQSGPRPLELGAGSLHTAFVIDDGSAIDLLWCADDKNVGERGSCALIP
jgi:hypothetical protein